MLAKEFVTTKTLTQGTPATILVPAMPRGIINRLRVAQLTGTATGFSYCVYNTQAAASLIGNNPTLAADERLYRVTPVLVVPSGSREYAAAEGFPEDGVHNLNLAYAIRDDHDGNINTNTVSSPGGKLVVWISPAAGSPSDTVTFGVAMTIFAPIL